MISSMLSIAMFAVFVYTIEVTANGRGHTEIRHRQRDHLVRGLRGAASSPSLSKATINIQSLSPSRRRLKSSKKTTSGTVEVQENSCTASASEYACDEDSIAICYWHDDHYHNKCVPMDDSDIYNKIPGVDFYKDKYPLVSCGCCSLHAEGMAISDNVIAEVKYPKSYDKDPYCDRFTAVPSTMPSQLPTGVPTAVPSASPTSPTVTPTTSQFPTLTPSSLPSVAPCTTFETGATANDVYNFCSQFEPGQQCCSELGTLTGVDDVENTCNIEGNTFKEFTICKESCIGKRACDDIASQRTSLETIEVGIGACYGDYACWGIGQNSEKDNLKVSIGTGSCREMDSIAITGDYLCSGIGTHSRNLESVTIQEYACIGVYSCREIGIRSGVQVTIGKNSCTGGTRSCAEVGYYGTTISIGGIAGRSCEGPLACNGLGKHSTFTGTIQVSDGECTSASTVDCTSTCPTTSVGPDLYAETDCLP